MTTSAQILSEIIADMEDWPSKPSVVSSILVAAGPTKSSNLAAVLVNETHDNPPWEISHLVRKFVPYFQRVIWHYYIVADGPHGSCVGFDQRPSDLDVSVFMTTRKIILPRINGVEHKSSL